MKVEDIKINFRTKQISDEELTLKFLSTLNECFKYLENKELFITMLEKGKLKSYKSTGDGELRLNQSLDKGKTWDKLPKGRDLSIRMLLIEYTNSKSHSWDAPPLRMKCETQFDFGYYYRYLDKNKLNKIYNGEKVLKADMERFETYVEFVKFFSKSTRKKLINHLYYFDNPKKSEHKKYKKFINGMLANSFKVQFNGFRVASGRLHSISYFKSFQDIRNQRIDQLLKNKKEEQNDKLKDESSTLCQRLTDWLKSKKTVSN